jgi:hypothetical protein
MTENPQPGQAEPVDVDHTRGYLRIIARDHRAWYLRVRDEADEAARAGDYV